MKLLPGEGLGWWSSQKFDRRVRMRALVRGAVNDQRTTILLDTGANVTAISERFAKKLRLKRLISADKQIDVQGIGRARVATTSRAMVKVTLGWEIVYEFEVWIMDHHAGVDLILGTDFMIPAGIRLDLYDSTAKLPDEVVVPLLKSQQALDEPIYGCEVTGGPVRVLDIPIAWFAEFKLQRRQPSEETHELWVQRTKDFVPTVVHNSRGKPVKVRLTNVSKRDVWCPMHFTVVRWIPHGVLPRDNGFVRRNSTKYHHWQLLAYENVSDEAIWKKECQYYEEWLAGQPPSVERRNYETPTAIALRPPPEELVEERNRLDSTSTSGLSSAHTGKQLVEMEGLLSTARELTEQVGESFLSSVVDYQGGDSVSLGDQPEIDISDNPLAKDPEEDLRLRFIAATVSLGEEKPADTPVEPADTPPPGEFEHRTVEINLEDYAHELAFLPDLTDLVATELDYNGDNVKSSAHTEEQHRRLVEVLRQHESIMISSGNALPPPAYGIVCDIDVQGHAPIKQRARRVPLRHLKKLYELLKGLLKAGLIAFSNSPWVSPIVIVLKKNGVDIRLCIDYKMVNAVTAVMEYAMPLVDDLLTKLESYLWFCSLDAASGFWAVLMTRQARWISAFVCALGHFEWLRMPFGLKNAPMIYQRLIDNALYGYVQPKGGWALFAELTRRAEEVAADIRATRRDIDLLTNVDSTSPVTKFEADRLALAESDPLQELINSPEANMFLTGEPDESKFVPVFERRSFVDDICFGGRSFDECLEMLDRLLKRFAECRISVSFTKSIFVHPKVEFLSHEVTRQGIAANSKKLAAIAEMPFPTSKKGMQAFLGALNYYSRFIQNLAVYGAVLYQLKEDDFAPGGDLTAAKASFAELKKRVVDAPILRHFDSAKDVHVMVFANEWAISSTLMQMHDQKLHPVRFCGRVLKENEMNYHLAEKEVLALLQFLKICYTLLTGKVIHVYTRFSTLEWVFSSKALYGRAVSFAVLLAPHHLKIKRVRERDVEFAQLLQASITPFTELDESMAHIAPPSKGSASVRLDPELLYAHVPTGFDGFVMSFDGSAKTEKNGGYGSCSWILWRLPTWDIVIAASAHLPRTTVNIAEYTGMNNGVAAAIAKGVTDLIIVGDSRLAIQQSMGVIACKKEALQIELARHKSLTSKLNSVRYLHVVRSYNAAADALATEALEAQAGRVVLSGERKTELKVLNRIAEVLCVDIKKPEETTLAVTAMTRSQTRRVRFADEDQGNSTSEARRNSARRPKGDPNELNGLGELRSTELDESLKLTESQSNPDDLAESLSVGLDELTEPNGLRQPPLPDSGLDELEISFGTPPSRRVEGQGNTEVDEDKEPDALDIDPVIVQAERRQRISKDQDEELKWADLKAYLRGQVNELTRRRVHNAGKIADYFVLSEDGLLYYLGQRRFKSGLDEDDLKLRLVAPHDDD